MSEEGNGAEEQDTQPDDDSGAVGYTTNGINSVGGSSPEKSPYYESRKLIGVPAMINGFEYSPILVDTGSPVTIIRSEV